MDDGPDEPDKGVLIGLLISLPLWILLLYIILK